MIGVETSKKPIARRFKIAVLSLVIATAFAALVFLGIQVRTELNNLRIASSDNTQWNLSQLEVEVLVFQHAIRDILSDDDPEASLATVRKRFDLLYSRHATLSQNRIFHGLSPDDEASLALMEIDQFLQDTVKIIDGPDTELHNSLAAIFQKSLSMRTLARRIALDGITLNAVNSEFQRNVISTLLLRTSLLASALILFLSIALVMLFNQFGVSERERTRYQKSNARLQSILESSLDAIVVADGEGNITDYNDAAAKIFGYTRTEAMGMHFSDIVYFTQRPEIEDTKLQKLVRDGLPRYVEKGLVELDAIRKTGDKIPIEVSIAATNAENGISYVSFLRDISERTRAQNELRNARDVALAADQEKSNFLAIMSHEMRTPLIGVMGTLDLMETTQLSSNQARYVDIAKKSGSLLLRHINDVLDIAKAEAGKLELNNDIFVPAELIDEIVSTNQTLANARGNTLIAQDQIGDSTQIVGDKFRLQQVILNLVGNAIKFTTQGKIHIESYRQISETGDWVVFQVQDDGIGISEANQTNIFDDFVTVDRSYRRSSEGTGLGLSICRLMIEAMDGEIELESQLGEGSTFRAKIPYREPTDQEKRAAETILEKKDSPTGLPTQSSLNILVVEDNQINRSVLRETLEVKGHSVTEATNGEEAVYLATSVSYDAILMDVSMPVMDGITATRMIRRSDGPSRATDIIGLTAHAMPAEQKSFRAAGMDLCLTKPVSAHDLEQVLSRKHHDPDKAIQTFSSSNLIDRSLLVDLMTLLSAEKFHETYAKFSSEVETCLRKIDIPKSPEEFQNAAAAFHKLSGSCGVFGARALHECASKIETACRNKSREIFVSHTQELPSIWAETREEIDSEVSAFFA